MSLYYYGIILVLIIILISAYIHIYHMYHTRVTINFYYVLYFFMYTLTDAIEYRRSDR